MAGWSVVMEGYRPEEMKREYFILYYWLPGVCGALPGYR